MIVVTRTNSTDPHFKKLVSELDAELRIRDGEDHAFFAQFNNTGNLQHVVVAYDADKAVGCGALREYQPGIMEVKRMYVAPTKRGQGIASTLLTHLENWCKELGYGKCILETGENQPEAIRLYKKCNYDRIPNYGPYKDVNNSVCFEKEL